MTLTLDHIQNTLNEQKKRFLIITHQIYYEQIKGRDTNQNQLFTLFPNNDYLQNEFMNYVKFYVENNIENNNLNQLLINLCQNNSNLFDRIYNYSTMTTIDGLITNDILDNTLNNETQKTNFNKFIKTIVLVNLVQTVVRNTTHENIQTFFNTLDGNFQNIEIQFDVAITINVNNVTLAYSLLNLFLLRNNVNHYDAFLESYFNDINYDRRLFEMTNESFNQLYTIFNDLHHQQF